MGDEPSRSRRGLRLVRDVPEAAHRLGAVRVVAAATGSPPFDVDAVVIEDDTYSVLGADPDFEEPAEHPIRIWTAVHEAVPAEPGTVIVRPGRPLRLLAVVHELSSDPTCREEWVSAALAAILRETDQRRLSSLALPVLGAVHGTLPAARFVELLRQTLEPAVLESLEQLWIVAGKTGVDALDRLLGSQR